METTLFDFACLRKTIAQELSESIAKWRSGTPALVSGAALFCCIAHGSCTKMMAGDMGAGLQKVAKEALAELVKAWPADAFNRAGRGQSERQPRQVMLNNLRKNLRCTAQSLLMTTIGM